MQMVDLLETGDSEDRRLCKEVLPVVFGWLGQRYHSRAVSLEEGPLGRQSELPRTFLRRVRSGGEAWRSCARELLAALE